MSTNNESEPVRRPRKKKTTSIYAKSRMLRNAAGDSEEFIPFIPFQPVKHSGGSIIRDREVAFSGDFTVSSNDSSSASVSSRRSSSSSHTSRNRQITGSNLKGYHENYGSSSFVPVRRKIDRNRAPKLAAILLLLFVITSTTNYFTNHFQEIISMARQPLSTIRSASNIFNSNSTTHHPINNFYNEEHFNFKVSKHPSIDVTIPNQDLLSNNIQLPHQLSNLADISTPRMNNEVPLLWHVPRAGGSTLKDIAAFCLRLTQASEVGVTIDPYAATQNQLVIVVDANTGAKFVNVDTTSPDGLERARLFNLAADPMVDLIVTPYLHLASNDLFNFVNQGRMFTLLRHPVDRAVSMYYYMHGLYSPKDDGDSPEDMGANGTNINENSDNDLHNEHAVLRQSIGETIDKYAKSGVVENNWMTRFLSNKMGGELTVDDEALAKEVLRTKALIGLLSRKNESFRRFEKYFGWGQYYGPSSRAHGRGGAADMGLDGSRREECVERLLNWDWSGKNKHLELKEGSETWKLLAEQNTFDIRVYEYAEKLFEYQADMFLD